MRYLGSKRKFARQILPIILKDRRADQYYVEPFVGAFNTMWHTVGNRIANDSNFYLIQLYKSLQKGWIPPGKITQLEYERFQKDPEKYSPELVAFAGFACSHSGKWFAGFNARSDKNYRNYAEESKRRLLQQAKRIQGVKIYNRQYFHCPIPKNSIVYCDPPYQGTTGYEGQKFNHDRFWKWVRRISKKNRVIISEYSAPEDFICIWSQSANTMLFDNNRSYSTEKLFVYPNERNNKFITWASQLYKSRSHSQYLIPTREIDRICNANSKP